MSQNPDESRAPDGRDRRSAGEPPSGGGSSPTDDSRHFVKGEVDESGTLNVDAGYDSDVLDSDPPPSNSGASNTRLDQSPAAPPPDSPPVSVPDDSDDLHRRRPKPPTSVDDFIHLLAESGLMARAEFQAFIASIDESVRPTDAAQAAELLVAQEKLTKYQAGILRRGKTNGLVLGNYEILEKLGEGGMGLVFKARHRRMKRLVALKILPRATDQSPEALGRFQREVEAAAKLQHANIAAAYDADEADGVHFLVMEYVEGPDLSSYVKQAGPLPVSTAVYLCSQAARGLSHAHLKGVVHRDVKPGNLMVNPQGLLKILDMGLAQIEAQANEPRDQTELTRSGRVMGTVDFMAPEQAKDAKSVDGRADIYSLGCTLFYLVSGQPPSPDGPIPQKLLWHQNDAPPSLHSVCSNVPESLERTYQRMMGKDPRERPQSMKEVADELDACLEELSSTNFELEMAGIRLTSGQPDTDKGYVAGSATIMDRRTLTDASAESAERRPSGKEDSDDSIEIPVSKSGSNRFLMAALVGLAAALLVGVAWVVAYNVLPEMFVADGGGGGDDGSGDGDTRPDPDTGRPDGGNPDGGNPDGGDPDGGDPNDGSAVHRGIPTALLPREELIRSVFNLGGAVTLVGAEERRSDARAIEQIPADAVRLVGVSLRACDAKDRDLQLLSGAADHLTTLDLSNSPVDDNALRMVSPLEHLESLSLEGTSVTNNGLFHVRRLDNLRALNLSRTGVDDHGMPRLTGLPRLRQLDVSDTAVGDEGALALLACESLEELRLHGTLLSDAAHRKMRGQRSDLKVGWDGPDPDRDAALALLKGGAVLALTTMEGVDLTGVESVADLPRRRFNVTGIDVRNPRFGDDDLATLVSLTKLRRLSLADTAVTADGLTRLSAFPSLQAVDLGRMPIARSRLEAIRTALRCDVRREPSPDEEVATWVQAAGGVATVHVKESDRRVDLAADDQLPDNVFVVTRIDLEDRPDIRSEDIRRTRELTEIESVNLASTAVDDEALAHLASCRSLKRIDLRNTATTNRGLEPLAALPSLEALDLSHTRIDGRAIEKLIAFPALAELALVGCDIASDRLGTLNQAKKLKTLDLTDTPLNDSDLLAIFELKMLQRVDVHGTPVSDRLIERLIEERPETSLLHDELNAERQAARWFLMQAGTVELAEGSISRLADLPPAECRVEAVALRGSKISAAEFVKHLTECPNLRAIELLRVSTQGDVDDLLKGIGQAKELRTLIVRDTRVSDDGLAHLDGLRQLGHVELTGCRLEGHGLRFLRENRSLKVLRLSNNRDRFGDRGLPFLSAFTELEELYLDGNTMINADPARVLTALTKLRKLGLRDTGVDNDTLRRLSVLTDLTYLDVGNTVVDDGAAETLQKMRDLRSLNLYRTGIGDATLRALQEVGGLTYLNVTSTKVTREGVEAFRAALPGCRVPDPLTVPRATNDPNQFGPFGGGASIEGGPSLRGGPSEG